MASFGDDWERFASRHLGDWHARSLAVSVADGSLVSSASFHLSSKSPTRSQTNPSSLLLPWSVTCDDLDGGRGRVASELHLRYNLAKLHVFTDGTYSADHSLVELGSILPPGHDFAHFAIEFALPASSTERVRAFLLYDESRVLTSLLLLEEARSGLFDTREPLAVSSLVGSWCGISETFRHNAEDDRGVGFGLQNLPSPSRRARRAYDEEDLPSELKNPSGGEDGLLKTKSSIQFGWDPIKGTVRRATVLSDMQDHELGRSVIYGALDSNTGGLFDFIRFESNTATESVLAALNNACFVMAPMKRVRGVPASGELGCHIAPGFRRRLLRIYGKTSVASETLASESLT